MTADAHTTYDRLGAGAFLQVPGLVDHEDTVGVTEWVHDDLPHITHRIGIPQPVAVPPGRTDPRMIRSLDR